MLYKLNWLEMLHILRIHKTSFLTNWFSIICLGPLQAWRAVFLEDTGEKQELHHSAVTQGQWLCGSGNPLLGRWRRRSSPRGYSVSRFRYVRLKVARSTGFSKLTEKLVFKFYKSLKVCVFDPQALEWWSRTALALLGPSAHLFCCSLHSFSLARLDCDVSQWWGISY